MVTNAEPKAKQGEPQTASICSHIQVPLTLQGPWSPGSPRLGPTVAIPASSRGMPNTENSQIPKSLKVLLKTLMPKGIHVAPRAGSGLYLCLSVHDIWETSAERGPIISKWDGRSLIFASHFGSHLNQLFKSTARAYEALDCLTTLSWCKYLFFYLEALENGSTVLGGAHSHFTMD